MDIRWSVTCKGLDETSQGGWPVQLAYRTCQNLNSRPEQEPLVSIQALRRQKFVGAKRHQTQPLVGKIELKLLHSLICSLGLDYSMRPSKGRIPQSQRPIRIQSTIWQSISHLDASKFTFLPVNSVTSFIQCTALVLRAPSLILLTHLLSILHTLRLSLIHSHFICPTLITAPQSG